MKFIGEELIFNFIDNLEENEDHFIQIRDEIVSNQLLINALLTDNNLDVLNEEEYDLLWFLIVVIFASCKEGLNVEIPSLNKDKYQQNEEANWKLWNETKAKTFRGRLDPFFKDYPQEDLLAFVEDSLESDEDIKINPIAQEIIFILSKSIIDTIDQIIE